MTLDDAIEMIKSEYDKATDTPYVTKPLAYALFQTWKKVDSLVVVERKFETDLTGKCGSCAWAMPVKGSYKGVFGCTVECQHPEKVWKHDVSKRRQRTAPRCRQWSAKEEGENDEQAD